MYVVPDSDAEDAQEDGRERFMLQVFPRGMGPPKTAGWQVFAAVVLLLLTVASTVRSSRHPPAQKSSTLWLLQSGCGTPSLLRATCSILSPLLLTE